MAGRQPTFDELMRDRFPDAPYGTCRWCGKRIESHDARRRRWHKACQEALTIRLCWSAMRRHVVERDGATCRACGLDCADMERELRQQVRAIRPGFSTEWTRTTALGRVLVDSGYDPSRSLWEVDHLVPLADGGSGEPEWLWVLCQVCHGRKTAFEAAARAGTRLPFLKPAGLSGPLELAAWWASRLRDQARPLAPVDPGRAWSAG